MKRLFSLAALASILLVAGCAKQEQKGSTEESMHQKVVERLAMYADTEISADMTRLTERQKQLVAKLIEAGQLADEIFWHQSAPDAIDTRTSLMGVQDEEAQDFFKYVMINYGPYDRIFGNERFYGEGPAVKPAGANYYPTDMTKEEFEQYVAAHPESKAELESQYTVVQRKDGNLVAVPFHQAYPEVAELAKKLEEAAELADNPTLKAYLLLRAEAVRTDKYYQSDLAWMDLKDNDIDIVIGPIENYEDGLFNYKTAYEAAVMIKDPEGTAELQMYKDHIDAFEHALPIRDEYKRQTAGSGNVLEVVNIAYFGGDFQAGVKTIAASLPNDPRVTQKKGGKKQMYKNMMEAKFDKIVVPIAQRVLATDLLPYVDRKAFTSFVTLHEVSHTLGMGYVVGDEELSVRKAMKERYSAIEECKADILGLYNNKLLLGEGVVSQDDIDRTIITYVAGLFRSLRFGAEEAHGKANLVQLNWMLEKGVLSQGDDGKYTVDLANFMNAAESLASAVLTIEIEGDYDEAGRLLDKYGVMTDEIREVIFNLKDIPRDLNTVYSAVE